MIGSWDRTIFEVKVDSTCCIKSKRFKLDFMVHHISYNQGLYKDRHSYGLSTMTTQLVGVFNFPVLKFEEDISATGVAFCH